VTGTQAACGVSGFRWSGLRKHSAVIGAPGTLRGFGGVGFQVVGVQKAQRCDGCAGPLVSGFRWSGFRKHNAVMGAQALWPAVRLMRTSYGLHYDWCGGFGFRLPDPIGTAWVD